MTTTYQGPQTGVYDLMLADLQATERGTSRGSVSVKGTDYILRDLEKREAKYAQAETAALDKAIQESEERAKQRAERRNARNAAIGNAAKSTVNTLYQDGKKAGAIASKYLGPGGILGGLVGFALTGGPIGTLLGALTGKNAKNIARGTYDIGRSFEEGRRYREMAEIGEYAPTPAPGSPAPAPISGLAKIGKFLRAVEDSARHAGQYRSLEEKAIQAGVEPENIFKTEKEAAIKAKAEKKYKELQIDIRRIISDRTVEEKKTNPNPRLIHAFNQSLARKVLENDTLVVDHFDGDVTMMWSWKL